MCFSRVVELLSYWRTSPPVHDLLALRYLGPQGKRGGNTGGSAPRSEQSEHEQISQIPQIAGILGVPVRKMSDKTRALYEYAESVLHPKVGV